MNALCLKHKVHYFRAINSICRLSIVVVVVNGGVGGAAAAPACYRQSGCCNLQQLLFEQHDNVHVQLHRVRPYVCMRVYTLKFKIAYSNIRNILVHVHIHAHVLVIVSIIIVQTQWRFLYFCRECTIPPKEVQFSYLLLRETKVYSFVTTNILTSRRSDVRPLIFFGYVNLCT